MGEREGNKGGKGENKEGKRRKQGGEKGNKQRERAMSFEKNIKVSLSIMELTEVLKFRPTTLRAAHSEVKVSCRGQTAQGSHSAP